MSCIAAVFFCLGESFHTGRGSIVNLLVLFKMCGNKILVVERTAERHTHTKVAVSPV